MAEVSYGAGAGAGAGLGDWSRVRAARHAQVAERTATIRFLIAMIVLLVVLCLALLAVAVLGWGAYLRMRNMVEMDCGGNDVVTQFELVRVVDVCREVSG